MEFWRRNASIIIFKFFLPMLSENKNTKLYLICCLLRYFSNLVEIGIIDSLKINSCQISYLWFKYIGYNQNSLWWYYKSDRIISLLIYKFLRYAINETLITERYFQNANEYANRSWFTLIGDNSGSLNISDLIIIKFINGYRIYAYLKLLLVQAWKKIFFI